MEAAVVCTNVIQAALNRQFKSDSKTLAVAVTCCKASLSSNTARLLNLHCFLAAYMLAIER